MTDQEAFNVVCDGSYRGLMRYMDLVQDAESSNRSAIQKESRILKEYRRMRKAGSSYGYRTVRRAIRSIYQQREKDRQPVVKLFEELKPEANREDLGANDLYLKLKKAAEILKERRYVDRFNG